MTDQYNSCNSVWTYLKFCSVCSGSNLTFQCPFLLCCDLLHHLRQFSVLSLNCLVLLFPLHLQLFCSPHLLFTCFTAKLQGLSSRMGSNQTVEVWLWNTVLKIIFSSPRHRGPVPLSVESCVYGFSCSVFLVTFSELMWCAFTGGGGRGSLTN